MIVSSLPPPEPAYVQSWSHEPAQGRASSYSQQIFSEDARSSVQWIEALAAPSSGVDAFAAGIESLWSLSDFDSFTVFSPLGESDLSSGSSRETQVSERTNCFNPASSAFAVFSNRSMTFEPEVKVLISALPPVAIMEVVSELGNYAALHDGWDGHGSVAPSSNAIVAATDFLLALRNTSTIPEPTVAADGQVGLFWFSDAGYIDISFNESGHLNFFSSVAGVEAKGSVLSSLAGEIPDSLMNAIAAI